MPRHRYRNAIKYLPKPKTRTSATNKAAERRGTHGKMFPSLDNVQLARPGSDRLLRSRGSRIQNSAFNIPKGAAGDGRTGRSDLCITWTLNGHRAWPYLQIGLHLHFHFYVKGRSGWHTARKRMSSICISRIKHLTK